MTGFWHWATEIPDLQIGETLYRRARIRWTFAYHPNCASVLLEHLSDARGISSWATLNVLNERVEGNARFGTQQWVREDEETMMYLKPLADRGLVKLTNKRLWRDGKKLVEVYFKRPEKDLYA